VQLALAGGYAAGNSIGVPSALVAYVRVTERPRVSPADEVTKNGSSPVRAVSAKIHSVRPSGRLTDVPSSIRTLFSGATPLTR